MYIKSTDTPYLLNYYLFTVGRSHFVYHVYTLVSFIQQCNPVLAIFCYFSV
jgi:hypothetical protein